MAHNLYMLGDEAAMMYVGEAPWHRLGTRLESPPTSKEAIQAAKLGWTVSKHQLYVRSGEGYRVATDHFVMVPDDRWGKEECPFFGVVGKDYTPLQNAQAFDFFDPVIAAGQATYETAGALGKGERIWVLAKMRNSMHVAGHDEVGKYLLLSNSHDGKSSVQVKFTPIRVVCQNTLNQAIESGRTYRVLHTPELWSRLKDVREILGLVEDRFAEIEAAFQAMAKIQMNGPRLEEYLSEVFPLPEEPRRQETAQERMAREKETCQVRALRERGTVLFENGKGNKELAVRGTLWAAYNGVVEMIDYHTCRREVNGWVSSLWFGERHFTKVRALRTATARLRDWG